MKEKKKDSDITERKWADKALWESEKKYRLLIETANESIVVAQDGLLKFVNPVSLVLLGGYSEQELLGRPFPEFIHPDDRSMVVENYRRRIANEAAQPRYAFRVVARDGIVKWVEINAALIEWQGKPATLNFLTEITERKRAEEALRESEVRFRELFNRMSSGVAVYEAVDNGGDFIIRDFNPAAEKIEKVSRKDILGKRVSEAFPGVKTFGVFEAFQRVWQTGKPEYFPENIYKDEHNPGSWRESWVFKLPTGEIVAIYNDITERKRAEEVLRESEEQFRAAMENAPDGVYLNDLAGNFLYGNRKTEEILGFRREEIIGKNMMDLNLLPPDGIAKAAGLLQESRSGKSTGPDELTLIKKDGNRIIVEINTSLVQRHGQPVVIGFVRDITERKRTEEALRLSEDSLREILNSLDGLVYVADMKTYETIFVNKYGKGIWGDFTGKTCWQSIQSGQKGPCSFCTNDRLLHPDGTPAGVYVWEFQNTVTGQWFECRDSAILWPDGRMVRLEIAIDITDRKRAESQREAALEEIRRTSKELQEKNDELNRFIYAVSHDLKSPLVTIQTFQGHLEQDIRSQDAALVAKDLGYIRSAADKMGRLLAELYALSQVGRIVNPSEESPLQAIVKEALDLVAGRIATRGVRVDLTEEPVVLYGDRTRLVEVFQNLVDNATKFMGEEPAPRVEIGVEQAGEEPVLYVRDNGIGIDLQVQPLVFGLFHKLDPGSEGEGIGLALVKRIVELHGGRIWVESEGPGKGTTFRFTLAKTRRGVGRIS